MAGKAITMCDISVRRAFRAWAIEFPAPIRRAGMAFIVSLALLSAPAAQAQIQRNIGDAISGNVARGVLQTQLAIRGMEKPATTMSASADGRYLVTILADGAIRVWDLEQGAQRRQMPRPATAVTSTLPISTRTGLTLVLGLADGSVRVFDGLTGIERATLAAHQGRVTALAASPDGQRIASGGQDRALKLWNLGAGATPVANVPADASVAAIAFDSTGGRVAIAGQDGTLRVVDAAKGAVQAEGRASVGTPIAVGFTTTGALLAAGAEGRAALWTPGAGAPRAIGSGGKSTRTAAIDGAAGLVAFGFEDGRVQVVPSAGGKPREVKSAGGAVRSIALTRSGQGVLVGMADGAVRLIDLNGGKELLQLVSTTAGWVVIDNQGRFDGSEGGLANVSWEAKGVDMTLDSFARRYFEPGMLAAYLKGAEAKLRASPGNPGDGVRPPPLVEIDIPEPPKTADQPFTAIVVAEDRGSGVQALRLYHNGKLVDPGALLQEQEQASGGRNFRVAAYRVQPTPGPNTLRAVAVGERDIESVSKRETLQLPGQAPPSTLHVVAIGINDYRAPELRLDFARIDADAFVERMRTTSAGMFAGMRVHRLVERQATRTGIVALLDSLSSLPPQDVVVLFLAGHGVLAGEEWVFLPQDVRFSSDANDYLATGLTGSQLQAALVKIRAQRILTAIDTCYSGGGLAAFEGLQGFHRRLFREVSRASGVTILAATRPDQSAAELRTLGHGVFTHVTLEGLAGAADRERTGMVTAHELTGFVADRLPAVSREYLGVAQEPSAFALGADFLIGRAQR